MIKKVNNDIYDSLGKRWFEANDDPVALLRAENRFRNPWILQTLEKHQIAPGSRVLDLGCGAGFLSQDLQRAGFQVTGIDSSEGALQQARLQDPKSLIHFKKGDLLALTENSQSFAACFLMDVLEHIENPALAFAEASRVLKPGGLCFFYTFNRTWLARLLVIQGVEFFIPNTPKDLHVYDYFLTPKEITDYTAQVRLEILELHGVGPKIFQPAMWSLLKHGRIRENFQFEKKSNLWVGIMGVARQC